MNKSFLILTVFFLQITFICIAQKVDTVWTKVIGGSNTEAFGALALNSYTTVCAAVDTTDDGFIFITTSSNSNNFFINKAYGDFDILVVKLNKDGDTIWSKNYGGTGSDIPYMLRATKGGGCVIVGKTGSYDFDFLGFQKGAGDGFIMLLNSDGTIRWVKTYGGTDFDMLYDIRETPDSAFVACGETNSADGDLLNTGDGLAWAIKVKAKDGKKIWSYAYVGPDHSNPNFLENFSRIAVLTDNSGYILCGYSTPEFGDLNQIDIFYVKVSSTGKTIWSKECGSDSYDGSSAVIDAGNGTFYIAGIVGSAGKDVKRFYGGMHDIWLAKFKADGTIDWEKNYGGSDWEIVFDAKKDIKGNIYLAGFSRSIDKDLTYDKAYGGLDFIIIKTNGNGDTILTNRIGGPDSEAALGICLLDKIGSSFILAGRSVTKGGYVNQNYGDKDIWLVRFLDKTAGLNEMRVDNGELRFYPNPVKDFINIDFKTKPVNTLINIYTINGDCIISKLYNNMHSLKIDISFISQGIYLLKFLSGNQSYFYKIIKIN